MIRREPGEAVTMPTVLLVDDDSALRMLLYRFLDHGGYNVLAASNGADALVICRQFRQPIALLLTDVEMPGMTGFELAERARELRPEMRVLLMTGGAGALPKASCSKLTVVAKPFDTTVLIDTIKQALRGA